MEIDVIKLFKAVLKKWWLVLLSMAICGALTFVYFEFFVTELYQTSASLYVVNSDDQSSNKITYQDINASQLMANDYIEVLRSPGVAKMIAKEMDGKYSAGEISRMFDANIISNSRIIRFTIKSPDPIDTYDIANLYIENGTEKIIDVFKVNGCSVAIEPEKPHPDYPSYPNKMKYTLLGAIAGFILVAGVILLKENFDTRIKTKEDFKNEFDIPIVGIIPRM